MSSTNKLRYALDDPEYKPNTVLNVVAEKLGAKCDAQLAFALDIEPSYLSRVRSRRARLSPFMLIRIMDITGLSIAEARRLAGIPIRVSDDCTCCK